MVSYKTKVIMIMISVQDDNFVLSAIFCAIEEDNKTGLEELLEVAGSIDINQANTHGEQMTE